MELQFPTSGIIKSHKLGSSPPSIHWMRDGELAVITPWLTFQISYVVEQETSMLLAKAECGAIDSHMDKLFPSVPTLVYLVLEPNIIHRGKSEYIGTVEKRVFSCYFSTMKPRQTQIDATARLEISNFSDDSISLESDVAI